MLLGRNEAGNPDCYAMSCHVMHESVPRSPSQIQTYLGTVRPSCHQDDQPRRVVSLELGYAYYRTHIRPRVATVRERKKKLDHMCVSEGQKDRQASTSRSRSQWEKKWQVVVQMSEEQ